MSRSKSFLALGLAGLALAAVVSAEPAWVRAAGLDVWRMPEAQRELEAANAEAARLEIGNANTVNRILAKEELVTELVAGRATLAEVAAAFLEMNTSRPGAMEVIREYYPGATDFEKSARNVIHYSLQRMPDASSREALARRLEAEFAALPAGDAGR